MSDDDKQAVVDVADAAPVAAVEAQDAREDDLDALLKQFDETKPEPKPEPKPDEITPDAIKRLEGLERTIAEERYRKDMTETLKVVRGDLDPEIFDDTLVEAWIDTQARNDPRLSRAWQERNSNPKQFAKVREQLGKAFAAKFSKLPDKQATEDRETVAAAIRGASTKAPKTDDIDEKAVSKMTDAEFEAFKRNLKAR